MEGLIEVFGELLLTGHLTKEKGWYIVAFLVLCGILGWAYFN